MKKLLFVFALCFSLSACSESESVSKLRQICEEDVKRQKINFDCGCQMKHFKKSLTEPQLEMLTKFVEKERVNQDEALNLTANTEFADIFEILTKIAPEIQKDCQKE